MFKSAKDIHENIPWQEMTVGCEIYEPGTSRLTKTGEWRSVMPIYYANRCKQCLMCTPYCPDSSIPVTDGKRGDFDLEHCKGCGICAKICPFGAIEMTEVQ